MVVESVRIPPESSPSPRAVDRGPAFWLYPTQLLSAADGSSKPPSRPKSPKQSYVIIYVEIIFQIWI